MAVQLTGYQQAVLRFIATQPESLPAYANCFGRDNSDLVSMGLVEIKPHYVGRVFIYHCARATAQGYDVLKNSNEA